jgi:hypothetical protein
MLHACFTPIALCFVYTSWYFYAFSRTTYCQDAPCLFYTNCFMFLFTHAVFVFQKNYTEIFSELDETKARPPIFPNTKTESKAEMEEDTEVATSPGGAPPPSGCVRPWCGPLGCSLTSPFCLQIASDTRTLNQSASIHEKFHSAAAIKDQFRGTKVSVLAPCRDGELPPEPSPSTPPPSSSPLLTPMMRRE